MEHMVKTRYCLPADLHRRLKVRAAVEGVSLERLIRELLDAAMKVAEATRTATASGGWPSC